MSNVIKFKKELDEEEKALLKQINTTIEAAGIYGWGLTTAGTPVLTGRARASWLLTTDRVLDSTKPVVKSKKRVYKEPDAPPVKFDIRVNNALIISNNVEYIEDLEYTRGFGMVQSAVPKINKYLEQRFKGIK